MRQQQKIRIGRKNLFGVALLAASVWPLTMAAPKGESGVKSETLLRTDSAWNGRPYIAYPDGQPELIVVRMEVPAYAELPWHTHPMPNAAYVESGEITIEEQNGTKHHFSAGQVIPETVNTPHRGIVGDKPAVFIVFYPGVAGMPVSKPER